MSKLKTFAVGLFKNIVTLNGMIVGRNVQQISFGKNNTQLIMDGNIEMLNEKEINIVVTGDVGNIQNGSGKIDVHGSVREKITSGSGDIYIADSVTGDIRTGSGKVTAGGIVDGDIKTASGNVTIKGYEVKGEVKTSSGKIKIENN